MLHRCFVDPGSHHRLCSLGETAQIPPLPPWRTLCDLECRLSRILQQPARPESERSGKTFYRCLCCVGFVQSCILTPIRNRFHEIGPCVPGVNGHTRTGPRVVGVVKLRRRVASGIVSLVRFGDPERVLPGRLSAQDEPPDVPTRRSGILEHMALALRPVPRPEFRDSIHRRRNQGFRGRLEC